jgi:predicted kinase
MAQGHDQLLFMRTGTYAALPQDFDNMLASEYAADLVVPADFRAETALGWQDGDLNHARTRKKFRSVINQRADQAVAASLVAGESVVFEGFLNLRTRREAVRDSAAAIAGVRVISLAVHTSPEVIRSRIATQHSDLTVIEKQLEVSREIAGRIEWPDDQEEHLQLSGDFEAADLLEAIALHYDL